MKDNNKPNPARVFIAYSRKDKNLLDELRPQLASLERDQEIDVFYDGLIEVGEEYDPILREQIRGADLVIFLLSPDFIASDYIMTVEVPEAFSRHDSGEAIVVPVSVRGVRPSREFAGRQFVPSKPIESFSPRGDGWLEVVRATERQLNLLSARDRGRHAGITLMFPQQFRPVLRRALQDASTVHLCSRTGSGWYRDHPGEFDRLCTPGVSSHFLFLNPDSSIFELDSRLQWKGVQGFTDFAGTVDGRRKRAKHRYDAFVRNGLNVRVTDIILPAVFWVIEWNKGHVKQTTAFLEVPVQREFYDGNLYIKIDNRAFLASYFKIFNVLWSDSLQWNPDDAV